MTAVAGQYSPLAPLVDETRVGSAGGQALTGIAGIVLAIILVAGQVSLATTKGIAVHLDRSVANITEGNETMEQVIERAAPTTQLAKVLDGQAKMLAHTRDAMVMTNAELGEIGTTTGTLDDVVGTMEGTSSTLATTVGEMDANTKAIVGSLGSLPNSTERTAGTLKSINGDMVSINAELDELSRKLIGYGLPQAAGAKTP